MQARAVVETAKERGSEPRGPAATLSGTHLMVHEALLTRKGSPPAYSATVSGLPAASAGLVLSNGGDRKDVPSANS